MSNNKMDESKDTFSLLTELLALAQEKQIPYTPAQVKKMSQEKLEEVMKEYKLKELDELNEGLADMVIIKFEECLKKFSVIKENSILAKKLQDRKLFKKDLKSIVSIFTPLLPYVGLLEGAFVFAGEVIGKMAEKKDSREDSTTENKKNDNSSCQTEEGY